MGRVGSGSDDLKALEKRSCSMLKNSLVWLSPLAAVSGILAIGGALPWAVFFVVFSILVSIIFVILAGEFRLAWKQAILVSPRSLVNAYLMLLAVSALAFGFSEFERPPPLARMTVIEGEVLNALAVDGMLVSIRIFAPTGRELHFARRGTSGTTQPATNVRPGDRVHIWVDSADLRSPRPEFWQIRNNDQVIFRYSMARREYERERRYRRVMLSLFLSFFALAIPIWVRQRQAY